MFSDYFSLTWECFLYVILIFSFLSKSQHMQYFSWLIKYTLEIFQRIPNHREKSFCEKIAVLWDHFTVGSAEQKIFFKTICIKSSQNFVCRTLKTMTS